MDKKTQDMRRELNRLPPDQVQLQLLLQGSIRPTVNQGIQEYANVFLMEPTENYPPEMVKKLKHLFRYVVECLLFVLFFFVLGHS